MNDPGQITRLLISARQGDDRAMDRLMPLVYDQLRRLARRQLGGRRFGGRRDATLDTTALVHEAYLKISDAGAAGYNDRRHFFSVTALAMRQLIVDYARTQAAKKRGGAGRPVPIEKLGHREPAAGDRRIQEVLAIDRALEALGRVDEKLGRLVELRYFGGFTLVETAEAMGVSDRTVKRGWRKARAFLEREIGDSSTAG